MTDEPNDGEKKRRKPSGKISKKRKKPKSSRNIDSRAPATPEDSPAKTIRQLQEDAERASKKAQIVELMATEALSHLGAAKAVGVDRVTAWRWRKDDPAFAEACSQAYEDGVCVLKDHATKIALGKEKSTGSDHLLITVIRSRDPSWRDPKYAPPVNPGPKVGIGAVMLDLDGDVTEAERAVILKLAQRQAAQAKANEASAP